MTIGGRLCGKAEVASWLMLALFYRLLERGGAFTWKRVAVLGALQMLWANLHGGYPLGIFVALCYSVGGWLEARRGAKTAVSSGHPPLWLPALLFLLAVADPWHFNERLAPFAFVTGSQEYQPIGESGTNLILEWRSPFRAGPAEPWLPWLHLLATGAGLASFVAARRWPLPRLLFFLGMAVLGATAIRHLPGLALAAALVILGNLQDREREPRPGRRRRERHGIPRRWIYATACGLMAVTLLGAAVALRVARPGFEGGQSGSFFTVRPSIACPRAADFILDNDLPGPIFNDFQMGAYLSYRLWPRHRLFIDSRVLDPAVVVQYTRIVGSPESWRQAESRYGFQTVVLGNFSRTLRSPLGMTLLQDPRWRIAYVDPLAVILVKSGFSAPPVFRLELPESGERRAPFVPPAGFVPPLPALQRAFLNDFPANYLVEYLAILGQLGRPGDVVALATRALETLPEHPLLYRQRCAAHLAQGDAQAAVPDCMAAYRQLPEDSQVVAVYAMALHRAGRRSEALSILRKALSQNRFDPTLQRALQSLGRI